MKIKLFKTSLVSNGLILLGIACVLSAVSFALGQSGSGTTYLPLAMREGETPTLEPSPTPTRVILGDYVIIGWNDLGMHCYDKDYADFSILPPYNNIWAQVIHRGDPPQIVTEGVTVTYYIEDNTYSAGKTNFWSYAQALFGKSLPLNIGLAGKGLSGELDLVGDHFVAEGVPVTEFRDSALDTPYYFQLTDLTVKDKNTSQILDKTIIVVPISSEIHCDSCHTQPYTNFRLNILSLHDSEEGTNLMNSRPVLCAGCHADPALGLQGQPGVPSFSSVIHSKHAEAGLGGNCYFCHPGPSTRCLRDVMSQSPFNKWCTDCHGTLSDVGNPTRTPWVTLPRCGNCHGTQFAENTGILYKRSTGHGGVYCEACHNSTHAILPSREANDNMQSFRLQGIIGTLSQCTICHLTEPASGGPHSGP